MRHSIDLCLKYNPDPGWQNWHVSVRNSSLGLSAAPILRAGVSCPFDEAAYAGGSRIALDRTNTASGVWQKKPARIEVRSR
jgi:hypothetical protein